MCINFIHDNERTLNLSKMSIVSSSYTYVFILLILEQLKVDKSEAVNPKSQMLFPRKAICYWECLNYLLI